MTVDLRVRIADHLAGRTGIRYAQNWEQVAAHSRLAYDLANGSAEVRKLLGSIGTHSVAALTYGLQWDSRDNEVSTHAGVFASVDVLFSPGGVAAFPYQYARTMATASFFVPISNPRVTLAVRVVGDALFGNPPFYELARFDNTYALGGANGVRGVPAQRYYGKLKAFGNVELRTDVVSFRAFDKPLVFGVVGFFDGGRLWADTQPHPELDGTGLGLKYGVGGGLRLQSGTAFVLRADIAWSPDATPIGGYFSAGQLF